MTGHRGGTAIHPVAGRCRSAVNVLGATLIVLGLFIVVDMAGIAMQGGLVDASPDWPDTYDSVISLLSAIYTLSFIASGLLFIRWQRNMTRNLERLTDAPLDQGVGLATWGWFIPILNLILPYRSLEEIARISAPEGDRPATALVGWWWAGWLSVNLSGWILMWFGSEAVSPERWITSIVADIARTTLTIVTGLLAIQMLQRLTRQQHERLQSLPASDPAPAVPGTDAMFENAFETATDEQGPSPSFESEAPGGDPSTRNHDRPTFRLRRARVIEWLLMSVFAGITLGFLAVAPFRQMQMEMLLASLLVCIGVCIWVGLAFERRSRKDVCSDPYCLHALAPEVDTCPGCGGTIAGVISDPVQRSRAAKQYWAQWLEERGIKTARKIRVPRNGPTGSAGPQ